MEHSDTKTIRLSIRIDGNVTSISLRKNIVALWLLLSEIDNKKNTKEIITEFVYSCLDTWKNSSAKGFSDYITDRMFSDFLDKQDFSEYKKILNGL